MDILTRFFPLSFQPKPDVASLVINILIHLVAGLVAGWVISVVVWIPLIGMIFSLIGSLLELYITAGIVIAFLDYFNILK